MLIFNYLKDHNAKIKAFYDSYDSLSFFGKALWWLMFVNWTVMALALLLLLVSAVAWNFCDGCSLFFWISLGFAAVVFAPWLIMGFVNSIKDYLE